MKDYIKIFLSLLALLIGIMIEFIGFMADSSGILMIGLLILFVAIPCNIKTASKFFDRY